MGTESSLEFREMAQYVSAQIRPADESMVGLKNVFQDVATIGGVSFPKDLDIKAVKHDPQIVAANAQILGDSLRETSGVHPKLPQSDIGSFFGDAFNLVKETAEVLKGQQPANTPEKPQFQIAAPAPQPFSPSPGGMAA